MQVLLAQHTDAQCVHQRVAGIGGVEDSLPADVGQTKRVAVATDAADHAVEHPAGVGRIGGAEAQLVHHRDRPGTHGHDVPHDPTYAGGRTLIRLHIGGVVVRLHFEGDRPAVADVDHPGVLSDPGEHPGPHLFGGGFTEVLQVHLRGLVGAVLAPHHRVHGQFGVGGAAAEDLADALILVILEAEFPERLGMLGGGGGLLDGVDGGHDGESSEGSLRLQERL